MPGKKKCRGKPENAEPPRLKKCREKPENLWLERNAVHSGLRNAVWARKCRDEKMPGRAKNAGKKNAVVVKKMP